jgi:hypothetical protein
MLEIMTLVPLWQPYHCAVKGTTHSKRGLLAARSRTVSAILQKHKHFRALGVHRLEEQLAQLKV